MRDRSAESLALDAPPLVQALAQLEVMRSAGTWPEGQRHLWSDAFGLVLLVSLYRRTGEVRFLDEARWLVDEVERVRGGDLGSRAWEDASRIGQRFQLAAWVFALGRLGRLEPAYLHRALLLAREVYPRFARQGTAPLDPFWAYVALRSVDELRLSPEIGDLREQIERRYRDLVLTRDVELGMMLWLTHFHPAEPWAELQRGRCLRVLEHLWREPCACFCREPGLARATCALSNQVISIGLQAVAAMPDRVKLLARPQEDQRPRLEDGPVPWMLSACAAMPGELLRVNWVGGPCSEPVRLGAVGGRH